MELGYILKFDEREQRGIIVFGGRPGPFSWYPKPILFTKEQCSFDVHSNQLVYFEERSEGITIERASLSNFKHGLIKKQSGMIEFAALDDCDGYCSHIFEEDAQSELANLISHFSIDGILSNLSSGTEIFRIDLHDLALWIEATDSKCIHSHKELTELCDIIEFFVGKNSDSKPDYSVNFELFLSPLWTSILSSLSDEQLTYVYRKEPFIQSILPADYCLNNLINLSKDYSFPNHKICQLFYHNAIINITTTNDYYSLRDSIKESLSCQTINNHLLFNERVWSWPTKRLINQNRFKIDDLDKDDLSLIQELLNRQYKEIVIPRLKSNLLLLGFNQQNGETRLKHIFSEENDEYIKLLGVFTTEYNNLSEKERSSDIYELVTVYSALSEKDQSFLKASMINKAEELLLSLAHDLNGETGFELIRHLRLLDPFVSKQFVEKLRTITESIYAMSNDIEELTQAYDVELISDKLYFNRYRILINSLSINQLEKIIEDNYTNQLPYTLQLQVIIKILLNKSSVMPISEVLKYYKEWAKIQIEYGHLNEIVSIDAIDMYLREQSIINHKDLTSIKSKLTNYIERTDGLAAIENTDSLWAIVYNKKLSSRFIYDNVLFTEFQNIAIIRNNRVELNTKGIPIKWDSSAKDYLIMPTEYDWVGDFDGGVAPVLVRGKEPKDDRYGLIKKDGTIVAPSIYLDAKVERVKDVIFRLIKHEKFGWGCISIEGYKVAYYREGNSFIRIPDTFEWSAPSFGSSVLWIIKNGRVMYVNKDFETVLIPEKQYDYYSKFYDRYALVGLKSVDSKGNRCLKYGLMNKEGTEVIPCIFDFLSPLVQEDRILFGEKYDILDVDGSLMVKYGFLNLSGDIVVEPKYDSVQRFNNGFAKVFLRDKYRRMDDRYDKYGIIDRDGNVIIDIEYNEIEHFSDNTFLVGNAISHAYYDHEDDYYEIRYGLISDKGRIIKPVIYNMIEPSDNGFAIIQLENLEKNESGETKKIYLYQKKEINSEGEIKVKNGKKVIWLPSKYEFAGDFHKGLAIVRRNGMWGFINLSMTEVIKCEYQSIDGDFSNKDEVKCITSMIQTIIYKINKDGSLTKSKPKPYEFSSEDRKENESYEEEDYSNSHTYEEYSGYYAQDEAGYSDQEIEDIFGGEPDAYWNID